MGYPHLAELNSKCQAIVDAITALQDKYSKAGEKRLRQATLDLTKYLPEFRKESVANTN